MVFLPIDPRFIGPKFYYDPQKSWSVGPEAPEGLAYRPVCQTVPNR